QVDVGGSDYSGSDIVSSVVAENRRLYESESRLYVQIELTRDTLPSADALLCHDCLVHLSYANIGAVLSNVARSNIRFVLMTSFPGRSDNRDVVDGDWRPLDFQASPFSFPDPLLTIVENCEEEGGSYRDKSLCAWRVQDQPRLSRADR